MFIGDWLPCMFIPVPWWISPQTNTSRTFQLCIASFLKNSLFHSRVVFWVKIWLRRSFQELTEIIITIHYNTSPSINTTILLCLLTDLYFNILYNTTGWIILNYSYNTLLHIYGTIYLHSSHNTYGNKCLKNTKYIYFTNYRVLR